MSNLLKHLSLQSVSQAHLFALRRFEEDLELSEKLQPHFYGVPAGWLSEIEHSRRMGWVGHLDDTYVEFLDITPEAEEGLVYLSIYVTPAYRQMGVGSSMVRMLAPRLTELGWQEVLAETEADNWHARRCLTRAGFCLLSSEEYAGLLYVLDLSCPNHGSD